MQKFSFAMNWQTKIVKQSLVLMMEVKNIGNQNTNSWHSLFLISLKSKTKQCKKLRAYLNNNVLAAFDQNKNTLKANMTLLSVVVLLALSIIVARSQKTTSLTSTTLKAKSLT
jgi:hypothetical protein